MTKQIQLLCDLTINQIAAGEVIEHPASVVKELVENAIDAGASQITVETRAGGFQSIRISDNGSGMSPEDAVLSLERHATSKIVSADDLFSLQTLGFRGEALASIASISKMELLTSLDGERAVSVRVEGGKIVAVSAAARAQGTTIEVLSLFYNVPARKAFQKTPASSSAEITKIMTQLSLAHPDVGFTLIQQERTVFALKAASLKVRAESLLNAEFVPSCKEFLLNSPHAQGVGLISDPIYARHNRSGQYLFINQRPVLCPSLSYAIKDAYGTRISPDKHPLYLLHFTLPPALLDVNVHPQKKEVRLREEQAIKEAVHKAVHAALGRSESTFTFPPPAPFSFSEQEPSVLFKEEEEEAPQPQLPLPPCLMCIGIYRDYLLVEASSLPSSFALESREGILFFHLRAAQKRVQFEQLLQSASPTPASQGLLFPLPFSCSLGEAEELTLQLPLLKQIGLHLEPAGKTSFLINAIPPFLEGEKIQEILSELIAKKGRADLHYLASLLSEKASRTSALYTLESARYLVQNLLNTTDPYHCPYGKPTFFQFNRSFDAS